MRSMPTPAMQVACVLLAYVRAVHGGQLTATLTFVQQPQPDARGLFAPVIRVEADASVDLEAMKAMVGLRIGAGSPAAAGLDGPNSVPVVSGYANFSAAFRELGLRRGAPGEYTLEAILVDRNGLSLAPAVASAPFELRAGGIFARLEGYWAPTNETIVNVALAPAVTVAAVDQLGNVVPCTGDIAGFELQVTAGNGQLCRRRAGNTMCDILPQSTATAHSVAGTATFADDLAVDMSGDHTLGVRAILAGTIGACATGMPMKGIIDNADPFQQIDTKGARGMTAFVSNGRTFLGVANDIDDNSKLDIKSDIYLLDEAQMKFERFQQIDTRAAAGMAAITVANRTFLAICNRFDQVQARYEVMSPIYELKQNGFVLFQEILTSQCNQMNFFTTGGRAFLAVANMGFVGLHATIYVLNAAQTEFKIFQQFPTPSVLAAGMTVFTVDNRTFLGIPIAQRFDGSFFTQSYIYVLNAAQTKFKKFQDIDTPGATHMVAFATAGRHFIGISQAVHTISMSYNGARIYVMNAAQTAFDLFDEIKSDQTKSMVAFTVAGRTLLGLANTQDPRPLQRSTTSDIYELNATQTGFNRIHRFDFGKSVFQMEAFTAAGRTFLGVAVYAEWGHTVTHESKSYIFEVTPRTVFTDIVRVDVRCSECPSGYTCPSALQTEPCPAGSACVLGVRRECPAGRYQEFPRQSNCVECAPGRYQNATGGTQCKGCPSGTFRARIGGSSTNDCEPCPNGKYAKQKSRQDCDDCPANTFSTLEAVAQNIRCEQCPGGQYSNSGAPSCKVCESGRFRNTSMDRCTACKAGEKPSNDSTACEPYCDPGHFCQSGLQLQCAVGRFQDASGEADCKACQNGQYQDTPGATSCKPCGSCDSGPRNHCGGAFAGVCPVCPPGYIINSTAKACTQCNVGRFQDNKLRRCQDCPLGKFQQRPGMTFCLTVAQCNPGEYVANVSALDRRRCGECAAGSYSTTSNAANCTACEAGRYQGDVGKTFCNMIAQCIPGEYVVNASVPNASRCVVCAAGSYSTASNAANCTACEDGKYQLEPGKTYCDACPANSDFSSANGACVCVAKHFMCPVITAFGADCGDGHLSAAERAKHRGQCLSCDVYAQGADCSSAGSTLASLRSAEGYWRATPSTAVFHSCTAVGGACVGGAISGGGRRLGRDAQCGLNRTGPLCTACAAGLVRNVGGKCTACAAAEEVGMLVAALALVSSLGAVVFFTLRSVRVQRGLKERAVKVRILFGFVQTLSRVNVSYQLQLPAYVVKFLKMLAYFEILDIAAFFGGLRCLVDGFTYIERVYVQTCIAVLLLTFVGAAAALAPRRAMRTAASNMLLLLSFVIYPSVVTTLFNVFGCTTYEDGRSYMDVDRSIDCDSQRHQNVRVFAGIMAPLFAIGTPLAYAVVLARKRTQLNPAAPGVGVMALGDVAFAELKRRSNPAIQHLAFLWRGYMPSMWWYEVYEMVRKFLLVGGPIVLRFIIPDGSKIGIVYGLLATVLTTTVLALGSPHLQKADEFSQFLSQICFFFALIAGTLVELLGTRASLAATVLVLGTAVPATMLMLFAVVCPRTSDRWLVRRRNRDLMEAIETLPPAALPPHMTSVEVAHAIGTMSQRDIRVMLKNPGLEAALRVVVDDKIVTNRHEESEETACVTEPKKIVV